MGLTGCSDLKKELKEKHPSALPNNGRSEQARPQVDIVAADMELCFFMVVMTVHSVVQLHNVGVQLLEFLTKTYYPKELYLMYETRGVPRVKSIEQERRDQRHTRTKPDDATKPNGTEFIEMMARLSTGIDGHEQIRECLELVRSIERRHGEPLRIPMDAAAALLSGDAMSSEEEFAARVYAYIAANVEFTRADLTQNALSVIADRVDLFSYTSDVELSALADLLCPEWSHLGMAEVMRKMFEKLLSTRVMRSKVRFFMASRILHAETDVRVDRIVMIGAPYVRRVDSVEDIFSFGLMTANLTKYKPSDEPVTESGSAWKDGDSCERTITLQPNRPISEAVLSAKRVEASMPGEGEAKIMSVAKENPGKTIVMMSRDSDSLVIILLGISQHAVSTGGAPEKAFGTLYLDMGATSPVDPTPYLVVVTELHRNILARAHLDLAAPEFPVETFCLRHLLAGCDYFTSPYALGPGAFLEGFALLSRMMRSAIKRITDPGHSATSPWLVLDEELMWSFVRILYATDLSMAQRVRDRPGFNEKGIPKLAKRTQRAFAVMSKLADSALDRVEGHQLAAILLGCIPDHETVVRESEEHAAASLVRRHKRPEAAAPAMPHDIELKTFWTEKQVRAYIRRIYWTINYFNGASWGQNLDPLATCSGKSVWGWSTDPVSHAVVLDNDIVSPDVLAQAVGA